MAGFQGRFGGGFATGAALRDRIDKRRLESLQREAAAIPMDIPMQEFTVPPSQQSAVPIGGEQAAPQGTPDVAVQQGVPAGPQQQPVGQTVRLPQGAYWDTMLKKGLDKGADPNKWPEFVETARNKTVLNNLTKALVSYKANPEKAGKFFMNALAHLNVPVYVQPDGEGKLVGQAFNTETGQPDGKPFELSEEYIYKLKKYYEGKYKFGVEEAQADYYRRAGTTKGKPGKVTIDWDKTNIQINDFMDKVKQGGYGESAAAEIDDPSVRTFLQNRTSELVLANAGFRDPYTGVYVNPDVNTLAQIPLYMQYGKSKDYKGLPVDFRRLKTADGKALVLASVGGGSYFILPNSLKQIYVKQLLAEREAQRKAEEQAKPKPSALGGDTSTPRRPKIQGRFSGFEGSAPPKALPDEKPKPQRKKKKRGAFQVKTPGAL